MQRVYRSSVKDRRAVSVERYLRLPLWNCDNLLLLSKNVTNCLWANLSFTFDSTGSNDMGRLLHGFPTSPSLRSHFCDSPHTCKRIRFKGIVHHGCDYLQSSWQTILKYSCWNFVKAGAYTNHKHGLMLACRHVHVRPHCFIFTVACSCRLELSLFYGKNI